LGYPDFSVVQTQLGADISNGDVFTHSVRVANLANNGIQNVVLRTNAKDLEFSISGQGLQGVLSVREVGSINAIGTAKTPYNRDRRPGAATSTASISNSASTTGTTEILVSELNGRTPYYTFILPRSSDYSLLLINESGGSGDFGMDMFWKEL